MATLSIKGSSLDTMWGWGGTPDQMQLFCSQIHNPADLIFTATKVTVVESPGMNSTFVWDIGGSFTRAADGTISGTVSWLQLGDLGPTGAGAKVQLMTLGGLNITYATLLDVVYGRVSPDSLLAGNDTLNGTGFVPDQGNYPGMGVSLFGGAGNDALTGTAYDDTLSGGTGNDTMTGGLGNDTYKVDSALDVINELAGQGLADSVKSAVSFDMALKAPNVENLHLNTFLNVNGMGNASANTIKGGAGNNVLSGAGGNDNLQGFAGNDTLVGGAGNDLLKGGAGNDVFRFNAGLNATTNVDVIQDFVAVNDTIQLENAVFSGLVATGVMNAGMLRAGAGVTTAADANDYIIYNQTNGKLYYDADANGAGAAVQFATIGAGGIALTNADFVVI